MIGQGNTEEFDEGREWLTRAAGGDQGALHALLDRYQGPLLGRIRLMMGPQARRVAESGDFVQIVMTEVLSHFHDAEITDERAFLRWTTTIARNRIVSEVRRRREDALESLSNSGIVSNGRETPTPASEADRRDKLFRLVEALERMRESERAVIEMRDFEGMTFDAIAEELGCSRSSARTLHQRALVELGKQASD